MAKVVKKVVKVVWIAVQAVVGSIMIALGSLTGQAWLTMLGVAVLGNSLRQFANLFISRPSLNNSVFERLQKQVSPTAPRRIVFGKTAGGADVRYFEKYASDDKYAEVIAVASHKIHAFKALYFEDTLTWTGSATTGKYAGGIISITARTEGSAANAFSMGSGSYWNTSCRMTGLAYLGIAYKLSAKKWPDGVPSKIMIEVEGCPVYDPRLDSTNGGSGTHRPDTQTTWAYYNGGTAIGRNPALCLLAYLIGWRINGRLAWGMGVPVTRIDLANFMAYANICEEAVTLAAGGTVQRYTCDLMVSTSDTHEAVITAITACMGSCQLTDTNGQYQLVGGYDDTAGPKIAYSADDMMGAYEWQPSPPSRERINIVRGRYCNPTKLYQLEDWPAVEVAGLYDGIPRVRTVELIGVTRAETAQRIAKQMLLRDQYPGRLSCAVGPRGFLVKVGSLVTLSLPTEGWNSKLFRVIDQTESHDLLFSMTLQEESPAIYAWDEEEKPLPADITPPGYDPADTRTPAALTATARTVAGGGGTVVPYIDVSWTPEASELVAGIEIQAKESAGTIWVPVTEGLFDAAVGAFATTANAPSTEIDIRARYRMMSGVFGAWVETAVTSAAALVPASAVDGLGWLATSSATGTLLLNAAYTAVAATAVTGNSGEVVLCATGTDGNQAVATDYEYSWSGRRRRVQRHPGHDAASPTIHTQQAGKKGFIVHHLGGSGGAFLAPTGALVRNRLLQSESLSVSPWSASGVSVSINAGVDHYGVQGLDRIIEVTSTGWHFIDQTYTHGSDPTGLSWTLSAVVQAGGRSKIQLCFPAAGGVFAMETVCNFDLATGTRISNTANVTGYGIVPLGGGLYRIWMTAPATGNAPIIARIFLLDAAGNRSYTGSGGLLYAGHVQLEQASTFTAYQCTTTGPAQRAAFCYKVGTQWYYDRGDGTQVAFTPDSNCIALGWLATSSTDTISGGGLLSPVTLTEAAFPAADVTAENTAANTAAVGGTPAADVEGSIANLSPSTGRALESFLAENGIGFAQIFDAGEARDGDTYTWPTTPTSVPRVVPMPAGNAATAGQNITIQAENVTLSGFTFRAKSQGVTPSSTITDTTEGAGGGSNPDRVINRSNSAQPYDNRWKFQFSVDIPAFGVGESGSAQVLFFLKKGGAWVQSGNRFYSASGTYTYDVISSSVDFGAGDEFGISIGADYSPGASITDFLNVKYTLGTVTETSLTPAGASPIPWIALI